MAGRRLFASAVRRARGVSTTYSYFLGGTGGEPFTGELKLVDYSDSTADISYTYDRMGRTATVADATGSRSFTPDETTLAPHLETFLSGNIFYGTNGLVMSQAYEGSNQGQVPGRWAGVKIGTAPDNGAYYDASYAYDPLGRLSVVHGPGLPAGGAKYEFLQTAANEETGLPRRTLFKDGNDNDLAWTEWAFEGNRDLVASVKNTFGDTNSTDVISKYEYVNDTRSRRQGVIYTGAAFGSGFIDDWSYNDRNELLGTDRKSGTSSTTINTTDTFDTTAAAADRRFTYDNIGNRATSDIGEAIEDPNQPTWTYDRNSLNQYYTVVTTGPFMRQYFEHDADGNRALQYAVGDINGDGAVDVSDLSLMTSHYGDTCSSHAGLTNQEFDRADSDGDCTLTIADLAGLLSGYGVAAASGNFVKFAWDAENRLIEVEPLPRSETNVTIPAGYRRLKFAYDYRGRRVEKRVYKRDSSNNANWGANPIERRRFVWNGWLMLRETIETDAAADGTFESTRTKTYTWGRDLAASGQTCGTGLQPVTCLESAGGIGGLLSVSDDATTSGTTSDDLNYVYFYDANGNVGQLSNLSGSDAANSLVAKYEYDAYGNVTTPSGTYATANTYRFSTKPWDDETGLGYWGFRWYEPRLGRWMRRDPIGEFLSSNLYIATANDPNSRVDAVGLLDSSAGGSCVPTECRDRCGSYAQMPRLWLACMNACAFSDRSPDVDSLDCQEYCSTTFATAAEIQACIQGCPSAKQCSDPGTVVSVGLVQITATECATEQGTGLVARVCTGVLRCGLFVVTCAEVCLRITGDTPIGPDLPPPPVNRGWTCNVRCEWRPSPTCSGQHDYVGRGVTIGEAIRDGGRACNHDASKPSGCWCGHCHATICVKN